MKKLRIIVGIIFIAGITTSCSKDDSVTDNNQSVTDVVKMIGIVNDIVALSEDALNDFDSRMRVESTTANDCKTVVHSPLDNSIVVDFGNNSCLLSNGISRQGKIYITYSGKYKTTGSEIEIQLDNYFSGSTPYKGKIKIYSVNGSESQLEVEDLVIPITDKDSVFWRASLVRKQTAGLTSNSMWDDAFEWTGTSSGLDHSEQKYIAEITSPLVLNNACFAEGFTFPTKGIIEIKTEKLINRTIHFGEGTCDKSIVLTKDGDSDTIRF